MANRQKRPSNKSDPYSRIFVKNSNLNYIQNNPGWFVPRMQRLDTDGDSVRFVKILSLFFYFYFFYFFFPLLHPKPLERSHASKAKSCPTTKGNCSSIANAYQRRRVSHLSQWGEDFDSPPLATFSAFGIESIPHHRVTAYCLRPCFD